ncbi:SCP2 sterol-binding domain-containing protein [Sulfobacillus harzensis]|uniref:SCP2 sterol-binding domain-containing protein n=1 Tax=Sulfobacillus harzensis TaxID=2729629 RepID=A0A7Y0L301_9FIRM|nr:SCP2 sterol-binding domain-containing protein [Sulfobacillus harzensis]NMP21450.1 SCP2 sterol-binding domain-containing protein [Sulfobacillus harzensis]
MTLMEALEQFVSQCNNNTRLREMNRDWSRRIQLTPNDTQNLHWLVSDGGLVSCGAGAVESPDMLIEAQESILTDIFSGQMTPTEPYNNGDLLVKGHQDDMMRLDILTLLIWGE